MAIGTPSVHPMVMTFKSRRNNTWGIVLRNKNYKSYAALTPPLLNTEPIVWEESGKDDVDVSLRGATGKLRIIVDGKAFTRDNEQAFFSAQSITDISVKVYKNFSVDASGNISGTLYFQGFVKPESSTMSLAPYPYEMEYDIVDCLAAADDIAPTNFIERCSTNGYTFTFKQLLEWWIEDASVDMGEVYAQANLSDYTKGLNIEKGSMFPNKYIDIKEHINNTPYDYVSISTYGDIFKSLLGTTNMYLRGRNIYLYRPGEYDSSVSKIYWLRWNWNGASLIKQDDGYYISKQTFNPGYQGNEHTTSRINKKQYYYESRYEKQDVSLKADNKANKTINYIDTSDGRLWGQGNLTTTNYCSLNPYAFPYKINTGTGKVTYEKSKNQMLLYAGTLTKALTVCTKEPISRNAIDALLLVGKIVKKVTKDGIVTDENDYSNEAAFSLKWGNLWYTGGHWGTTEYINALKMAKDHSNADTNNFRDGKCDPIKDEGVSSYIDWALTYGVSNYEGIHIPLPTSTQLTNAAYMELNIYCNSTSTIYIEGLELKSVNEDSVSYIVGDEVAGESIDYPGRGGIGITPDVWSKSGHSAYTLYHIEDANNIHIPLNMNRLYVYDDQTRMPMAVSYNPWEDNGSVTL